MSTNYIGQPISRVDGRAKVTGQAKYAGEYNVPNLTYGVVVSAAVAKGRITKIDTTEARQLDGVIEVFTHENAPRTAWLDRSYRDQVAPPGSPFHPLHNAEIVFSGQPIALVVADSLESARYAASLVRVEYERDPHVTDLREKRTETYEPKKRKYIDRPPNVRGNPDNALTKSRAKIDVEYSLPIEHHNPMEPFATTVVWSDDGKLTIYEKTQGPQNNQNYVCRVFGLADGDVRVLSPYVGGAFGSGLRPQYQLFLAVMAARELKRSVRVTLTRQQMFTLGHRPQTLQRVALGAAANGKLQALIHEAIGETSHYEDYSETVVNWSGALYPCQNVKLDYSVAQLDLCTPMDMRAPGAAWGLYALESAMDELAYELQMDPIDLRLKNYAKKDLSTNKSFSSNELRECYRQAAERFGWSRRSAAPRSMRDGDLLVGWGMATGVWETMQIPASARAVLTADGKLTVSSATADIGTGTYTIMTQVAADTLGLPIENVTFKLGDSSLPNAPVEGGSFTAATVGSAVLAACDKVRRKVFRLASKMDHSPFARARFQDVVFAGGCMKSSSDPSVSVAIMEAMRHAKVGSIEEEKFVLPNLIKQSRYTRLSHSAVFVEVKVDEDLSTIEVSRAVSAIGAGRILNPKTARSQIMGGIVWGIGMALQEQSVIDQKFGRIMNHNLAEYHVPVNADVGEIDVIFVEEHDSIVNPLGVKGVGELGLVGVAAAIGNAVFHATGKRIHELPITVDKLLRMDRSLEQDIRKPAA
jgi:xanthine dehydrogenase YagR molybdenum-binding subunit